VASLSAARLSRAALWCPAVGVLVGCVAGGVRALAGLALDPGPATVLALLAAVLVTGGLHEDGLADSADAIGAHVGRERRLEILHDSRVGTYGALALVLAMLFAFATLVPLDAEHVLRAAIAGHVLGRWSTLPLSLLVRPATAHGSGALVRAGRGTTVAATAMAGGVVLATCGIAAGTTALVVAVLTAVVATTVAVQALGGVNGDVYGAVNKLVELATYAVLGAWWA
jgi:adenosylcobinamide-GDP ribazoletransferase